MRRWIVCLLVLPLLPLAARAGVYHSSETMAELPAQWRGFLLDQRLLRLAALPPRPGQPVNAVRQRYLADAEARRKTIGTGKPTADQAADLGAIYLRLGDVNQALEYLLPAQREHPEHFRLTANLATALHQSGELNRARETL